MGTQAVQYDTAGNLLNTGSGSGTYSYTWDAEGRMGSVGSPAGTTVATYVYNALGQRVERSGSGVPSSPLYEVYDAFGNLAFVTNNGTMGESLIGLGGRNFAKYTPSGTFFLHADALGSWFFSYRLTAGKAAGPKSGPRATRERGQEPLFLREDALEWRYEQSPAGGCRRHGLPRA